MKGMEKGKGNSGGRRFVRRTYTYSFQCFAKGWGDRSHENVLSHSPCTYYGLNIKKFTLNMRVPRAVRLIFENTCVQEKFIE